MVSRPPLFELLFPLPPWSSGEFLKCPSPVSGLYKQGIPFGNEKDEILPFATTRMELEADISQAEKDRYRVFTPMWILTNPDFRPPAPTSRGLTYLTAASFYPETLSSQTGVCSLLVVCWVTEC